MFSSTSGPEGSRKEAKNSAAYPICLRLKSTLSPAQLGFMRAPESIHKSRAGELKAEPCLSILSHVSVYIVCLCFVGAVIWKWTTWCARPMCSVEMMFLEWHRGGIFTNFFVFHRLNHPTNLRFVLSSRILPSKTDLYAVCWHKYLYRLESWIFLLCIK